jgi:hypothetical protein
MIRKNTLLGIAGLVGAAASPVFAQPLPGEALKFIQYPLGDTATNPNTIAPGHDELSTAVNNSTAGPVYSGTFAADDFSDNVNSPVVDVQWWGSYLGSAAGNGNHVQDFLISFESDIPGNAAAGTFSEPGSVILSQTVKAAPVNSAASGTFTEALDPTAIVGPDGPLYEYNAELATPFPEVADTIYWLKIVALTNPSDGIQWGWHNRDYTITDPLAAGPPSVVPGEQNIGSAAFPVWHFQDDAVTGNIAYIPSQNLLREVTNNPLSYNNTTDGFPPGAVTPSEDLAFGLYYAVPEPVGLPVLAAGLFLLRRNRRHA